MVDEAARIELLDAMKHATRIGDRDTTVALTEEALRLGLSAEEILDGGPVAAMDVVGEMFSSGEMFVPEMLLAARAMKGAMDLLRPMLAEAGSPRRGTCVIGSVEGDLHDIGQNLVSMLWEGAGFVVHNLGTSISGQAFVDAIEEYEPDVLGMSSLLTTTMMRMPENIALFAQLGLSDRVKVLVGGAPVTEEFAAEIGADGWAPDAATAAGLARRFMTGA